MVTSGHRTQDTNISYTLWQLPLDINLLIYYLLNRAISNSSHCMSKSIVGYRLSPHLLLFYFLVSKGAVWPQSYYYYPRKMVPQYLCDVAASLFISLYFAKESHSTQAGKPVSWTRRKISKLILTAERVYTGLRHELLAAAQVNSSSALASQR